MACASESDMEKICKVLDVIFKTCHLQNEGQKMLFTKYPSSDAEFLGPNVSLVRNAAVAPVIVFNCLILILYFSTCSLRKKEALGGTR